VIPSWFSFLRLKADLAMKFVEGARLISTQAAHAQSLTNARMALNQIERGLMNPATRDSSDESPRPDPFRFNHQVGCRSAEDRRIGLRIQAG
jgi:hypothetical protein